MPASALLLSLALAPAEAGPRVLAHGVVCALGADRLGYFGWPTVARLADGTLVVGVSGLREAHICPFGRTVLLLSRDEGAHWTGPRVINDSPLDDRDVGVVPLGGDRLLITWFTRHFKWDPAKVPADWDEAQRLWTEAAIDRWSGSWCRLSDDRGETWSDWLRTPVSSPHGPLRLQSGRLLYLGKGGYHKIEHGGPAVDRPLWSCVSDDDGRTWTRLGEVAPAEGTLWRHYHEAHALELPDGKLLGMLRFQAAPGDTAEYKERWGALNFSLFQTESADGGVTWTIPRPLGVLGSPPHLLRHSSGAVVCVYGYRQQPYGQRAIISRDDGRTWSEPIVLRDDGPDSDLGYPSSVELSDGSLLTVYYQKLKAGDKCGVLWTRWTL